MARSRNARNTDYYGPAIPSRALVTAFTNGCQSRTSDWQFLARSLPGRVEAWGGSRSPSTTPMRTPISAPIRTPAKQATPTRPLAADSPAGQARRRGRGIPDSAATADDIPNRVAPGAASSESGCLIRCISVSGDRLPASSRHLPGYPCSSRYLSAGCCYGVPGPWLHVLSRAGCRWAPVPRPVALSRIGVGSAAPRSGREVDRNAGTGSGGLGR